MLVVNVNALYWSKEGKESHTKSLRASILYVLKTTFLLIALKPANQGNTYRVFQKSVPELSSSVAA